METLTIRVSRSTHGALRQLADRTGETMTEIVDRAVREYERMRFWADYQSAYAALAADSSAWADLQGEIESWDSTSADGLEEDLNEIGATDRGPVPR
jgi:predicted transcriptional regulator